MFAERGEKMTVLNVCGILFFILLTVVGAVVKRSKHRIVKGLDGDKGLVKKDEKKTEGNIVARFGD